MNRFAVTPAMNGSEIATTGYLSGSKLILNENFRKTTGSRYIIEKKHIFFPLRTRSQLWHAGTRLIP
jgi:hypothetical protein